MRRRLILTTAMITLVALLLVGIPLGVVESRRARSDELARLEREADSISAAIDDSVQQGVPLTAARLEPLVPNGRLAVARSGPVVVRAGTLPSGELLREHSGASSGARVTVVASADEVNERKLDIWLLIAGLVLAGTAAAAGLAVIQARRLTRPINRLVRTSDELGAGDFSARAGPLDVPELDQVGKSLDASAARIATLVGRQREFAANVSHQLRSPLTGLKLRLEALESRGDDPDARAMEVAAAMDVTDRLERTIDDLLTLARAGTAGTPSDVDLAALASEHAHRWEPEFARAHRQIIIDVKEHALVRVTPGGVAQALDVLIENSLWHGKGPVRISTGVDGDGAFVRVTDNGPGIREGDEEIIFDRDVSRTGSTGLGLSLARALVEADGGRLLLAEARPPVFEIRIAGRPPS